MYIHRKLDTCISCYPITRMVAKMKYETEAEPRSSNSILADVRVIGVITNLSSVATVTFVAAAVFIALHNH